jgi:geranylgeranyl reductase family protein
MPSFDVIVVGGGPSGAVLAYQLAKKNLKILIIEKAVLPRYKCCGGGVPRKTANLIPFDISPVIEQEAVGGIVTYQGRRLLKTDVSPSLASYVKRDNFDYFLVNKAVEAGAELLSDTAVTHIEQNNTSVTVETNRGTFNAAVLVGADGVNSLVAHSSHLLPHRKTGTAIEGEFYVPTQDLKSQGSYATFDFGALPKGYGWIFPKSDHLSVGVFYAKTGSAVKLKQHFESFVASQKVLQNQIKMSYHGHRIPLGGDNETLHQGRVLLIGDAANLADAWLGEGIYYAIASAHIAAEEIVKALPSPSPDLSYYTMRVNAEIVTQLRQARTMGAIVYNFPYLCSNLISKSIIMQDAVFSTIRGDYTLGQMNKMLLTKMFNIFYQALFFRPKRNTT